MHGVVLHFRFTPVLLTGAETSMFHGLNEQIPVEMYAKVVDFYYRIMTNADYDQTAYRDSGKSDEL